MNRAETSYWLKCEGYRNSYIAELLGICRSNVVSTLAKKYALRTKQPHWSTYKESAVEDMRHETAYWLKGEGHTNSYIAELLGIHKNVVPALIKKHALRTKQLQCGVSKCQMPNDVPKKSKCAVSAVEDIRHETAYWLKCEGYANSYIADVLGINRNVVPTFAKKYMMRHDMPRWNTVKIGISPGGPEKKMPLQAKAKAYQKETPNTQINDRIQVLAERVIDSNNANSGRDMNELMTHLMPKLKFFIWNFMKVDVDADDVLHNALEKICLNMHMYNPTYRFTTWAYNIAKNESLTWLNKLPRGMVDIADYYGYLENTMIDDSVEVLEKEVQRDDVLTDVYTEIHRVSFDDGNLMLLEKDINRRKCRDIAEQYSMNTNTVKTKIRAGRRRVHERIMLGHEELTTKLVIFEL